MDKKKREDQAVKRRANKLSHFQPLSAFTFICSVERLEEVGKCS